MSDHPGTLRADLPHRSSPVRLLIHVIHTILCLGLNYAIPAIRMGRWAKYVLALIILNELRGLYMVYLAWDKVF